MRLSVDVAKNIVVSILLVLGTLSLGSCVSTGEDPNVLERSAQFRPAWANLDFSGEGSGDKFVVAIRRQVPKLELGIKQTQAAALQDPCEYGQNRIAEDVKKIANKEGFGKAEILNLGSMAKNKLILANFCPRLASQTVYWELVAEKNTEIQTYSIFVLLTMRKQEHLDGLTTIATHFKSGTTSGEKKVAELLIAEIEGN